MIARVRAWFILLLARLLLTALAGRGKWVRLAGHTPGRRVIMCHALGRCFEPTFPNGTRMEFDPSLSVRDGDLALLRTVGGLLVKRVRYVPKPHPVLGWKHGAEMLDIHWFGVSLNEGLAPLAPEVRPCGRLVAYALPKRRHPFVELMGDSVAAPADVVAETFRTYRDAHRYIERHAPDPKRVYEVPAMRCSPTGTRMN